MKPDSGQPIESGKPMAPQSQRQPEYDQPQPEYDRRGILLPARARVGGIITPQ